MGLSASNQGAQSAEPARRRIRLRWSRRLSAAISSLFGLAIVIVAVPTDTIDSQYDITSGVRTAALVKPFPKGGGTYRVGDPYVKGGRVYVPREDPNYRAVGIASWYGGEFHGRLTANGEIFNMYAVSAAHPTLPLPSYVRITNLENRRTIIVRLNDRGPFHDGRLIDVSVRTAKLLGFYNRGIARVRVDYIGPAALSGSDDDALAGTLSLEEAPATRPVADVLPAETPQVDLTSTIPTMDGIDQSPPAPQSAPMEIPN